MAEQELKVVEVCMDGRVCSNKYLIDHNARVGTPGYQGTGNAVLDLNKLFEAEGMPFIAVPKGCFGVCPLPGVHSTIIGPDGELYRAYCGELRENVVNPLKERLPH